MEDGTSEVKTSSWNNINHNINLIVRKFKLYEN